MRHIDLAHCEVVVSRASKGGERAYNSHYAPSHAGCYHFLKIVEHSHAHNTHILHEGVLFSVAIWRLNNEHLLVTFHKHDSYESAKHTLGIGTGWLSHPKFMENTPKFWRSRHL